MDTPLGSALAHTFNSHMFQWLLKVIEDISILNHCTNRYSLFDFLVLAVLTSSSAL